MNAKQSESADTDLDHRGEDIMDNPPSSVTLILIFRNFSEF